MLSRMKPVRTAWGVVGAALVAGAVWVSAAGIERTGAPAVRAALAQAPADQGVPADLRPLLAPAGSELRFVTIWYNADRSLLSSNYASAGGGRGGGGGRGAARGGGGGAGQTVSATPVPLSPNRLARLKRFDMEWTDALATLDVSRFSAAARSDLEALKATVATNLQQIDVEARAMAEVAPVVPFLPTIVRLVEGRIKVEDMDAQRAAGDLTAVTKEIARTRARLDAGLSGQPSAEALRVSRDQAVRAADTTDALRSALVGWFGFYNGYDPLFTWWMGLPYKHVDAALQEYGAFLRDKVAPANQAGSRPVTPPAPVTPSPAPKFSSVPDLAMLTALRADEMTPIVQLFSGGGGRGGRGAGGAAPRGREFYQAWLAALKTLDFDRLSRNAQVDYLFIKKSSEMAIARMDFKPQVNIPRKTDTSGIEGPARGRDGLVLDLRDEMIPYSPEELIALANKQFAWQEEEMKKASRLMGLGDDWKQAIAKVKDMHPPPGGQPAVIRDMLYEAVDYLRAHDLVTVPPVAAESFRMSMMSPERQLVNPFFTGGAQITVSYPTDTMEYDQRMQSMRGNNTPFSHATAHHEMIPGHNLTGYMSGRFSQYRPRIGSGSSPFFGEGWAVYWETMLYDRGFHDTPEERVGALFWLMHRSARIIFSLNFHMGVWSPQECIDFLVDRVGHERENATAEVRRSFDPSYGYGPLYQAAYLLGALQLRGLRTELVTPGRMTEKQFHDAILRQGSMPIPLIRLGLMPQPLTRDMDIEWKFPY